MDKQFLEKMEKALLAQKKTIISGLISSNDDFKAVLKGEESGDLADAASDDIDRRLLEATGAASLKRLKVIDAAISRIKQGRYGLCIKCGKQIPNDRLEVLPYALMCIDCKTIDERRHS